jgi:plastocyanin
MKAVLGILAIVAVVGVIWWKGMGGTPAGVMEKKAGTEAVNEVVAKNTVEIKSFAFAQPTITIKVGESVVWKNSDATGHSATADDKSFDTGILAQGESSEPITFSKAGTYTYHCTPHPNMKATVIVTE